MATTSHVNSSVLQPLPPPPSAIQNRRGRKDRQSLLKTSTVSKTSPSSSPRASENTPPNHQDSLPQRSLFGTFLDVSPIASWVSFGGDNSSPSKERVFSNDGENVFDSSDITSNTNDLGDPFISSFNGGLETLEPSDERNDAESNQVNTEDEISAENGNDRGWNWMDAPIDRLTMSAVPAIQPGTEQNNGNSSEATPSNGIVHPVPIRPPDASTIPVIPPRRPLLPPSSAIRAPAHSSTTDENIDPQVRNGEPVMTDDSGSDENANRRVRVRARSVTRTGLGNKRDGRRSRSTTRNSDTQSRSRSKSRARARSVVAPKNSRVRSVLRSRSVEPKAQLNTSLTENTEVSTSTESTLPPRLERNVVRRVVDTNESFATPASPHRFGRTKNSPANRRLRQSPSANRSRSNLLSRRSLPSSPNAVSRSSGLLTTRGAISSDSEINQSIVNPSSFALPQRLHTRNLLTASVYHNQATGLWITTINTNQKSKKINKSNAAKYLKAFSFHSEREARESAYANAPPKMLPFDCNPTCFVCTSKFTVFKRASHCRNCGVCICSSCSTSWSKHMIPETYNIKNERSVRVCKTCNFLSRAFRHALIQAQFEDALAIYNSGNINLRCPFLNVRGSEAKFPIHCAAEGGSLKILKWLVDIHFCPIKMIRTGNKNKTQGADEQPITTSKGRSVLEIAMVGQNADILRYLVNEKKVSVYDVKDVNTSLAALDAVLKLSYTEQQQQAQNSFFLDDNKFYGSRRPYFGQDRGGDIGGNVPLFDVSGPYDDENEDDSSLEDDSPGITDENEIDGDISDEDSVATTVHDACIICYENSIDCVITPCGHQICCLECSEKLKTCPVCHSDCQFIRIFRP